MSRSHYKKPHRPHRAAGDRRMTVALESLEQRSLMTAAPGPDAFGYSAVALGGPPRDTVDLVRGAEQVVTFLDARDDFSAAVNLGRNQFQFYGQTYSGATSMYLNDNGLITFTAGTGASSNVSLSATGAPLVPAIAPLWDDWRTDLGSLDCVLGRFLDQNADGIQDLLVIEWNMVTHWPTSPTASDVTFQAILELNTGARPGDITFNYPDLNANNREFSEGASATVGIKGNGSPATSPNLEVLHNTSFSQFVGTGKAMRITGNTAPVVNAGGPYAVAEGSTVSLTATARDAENHRVAFDWDLDRNGSFETQGATTTFAGGTDGPGTFSVPVRATDELGLSSTGVATVTVTNVAPVIRLSGPSAIHEGGDYALTLGNVFDPGRDTVRQYTVRWGDGATATIAAADLPADRTLHHTYADGTETMRISVGLVDEDGTHASAGVTSVTVNNVAPTIAVSGPTAVEEGGVFALVLGTVADTGVVADPQPENVTLDDGTPGDELDPLVLAQRPTDDYAGGTVLEEPLVQPLEPSWDDPVADVDADGVLQAPRQFAVDPGADTAVEYVIDWGDGTVVTVAAAALPQDGTLYHVYADDIANAVVSVAIKDEDGTHENAGTTSVAVANVAPTISLAGPAAVNEGGNFALVLGPVTDPGADTVSAYVIHWGDGATATIAAADLPADRTLHHTYVEGAAAGTARTVTVNVKDEDGAHSAGSIETTVQNVAPRFSEVAVTRTDEGGTAVLTASLTDAGATDTHFVTIDWGDGSPVETLSVDAETDTVTATHKYVDDRSGSLPDAYDVALTVNDDDGGSTAGTASAAVGNVAPTATFDAITGTGAGYVVAAGVLVSFHGRFVDPGIADTHRAVWEISDDNFAHCLGTATGTIDPTTGVVTGGFTFAEPGVYKVRLVVIDDDGGTGTADQLNGLEATVVAYDATAGFVTGGGWIDSPAGSYAPNPALTGKAQFAFVSKYKSGSTVPVGTTQFLFKSAGLHFSSSSYDFMVVSGHKAQFRGTGTLNGRSGYRFKLTAIDGHRQGGGGQDKFRIQIWNTLSNTLVYDNQRTYDAVTRQWNSALEDADPTTLLAGGSIVIHS